jgi:hypothetical protein
MSRAVVCAGGVNTSYVRAGRGKPIVLVSDDVDAPETQEMIATLARDHLVFAASPPVTDGQGLGVWLRNFAEGLGINDAHLVLHPSVSPVLLGG